MTENTQDIAYNLLYYQSNLEPNVEMAISIGDQQRIFLAYRALFKGQNAQVRQNKTIKKILISSKASSSPLVRSLGLDKVVSVLKRLLEKEVFSSELKAKVAFPILYKTSPEQNARHEASDVGAAKVEAKALQEVEAIDDAQGGDNGAGVLENADPGVGEGVQPVAAADGFEDPAPNNEQHADTKEDSNEGIPSLYPVQFPFKVQHSILARSQKLLEEACYDFTQKHAANLLTEKKWDCAEAIELNKWTFTMMKRKGKLATGAFEGSDYHIDTTLLAVNKLRHSAVHRLRISAKGILQMIFAATELAQTMSDATRASQLEDLSKELQSMIQSQELNKNYLETKLNNELDEIKRLREELMKREQEAISTMVTEDKQNAQFVGSLLERRLRSILDGQSMDDELQESDPQDQLDNVEAEAINGIDHKEEPPVEQELSKSTSKETRLNNGVENVVEETAQDDSMVNHDDDVVKYVPIILSQTFSGDHRPANTQSFSHYEDVPVEESQSNQTPVTAALPADKDPPAEPTATEPQPDILLDGADEGITNGNDLPEKDASPRLSETRDLEPPVAEPPETDPPATESPPKQAIQDGLIEHLVQALIQNEGIDTASLRTKSKGKKKLRLKKIQNAVSEGLRSELENVFYLSHSFRR
ncbi:MAG: hypothetical protein L6R41_003045 [Letrouitia leprolyta]|nr:MAG: hypothetical protein L6R41_003045 [Letrouitia leprolyta]